MEDEKIFFYLSEANEDLIRRGLPAMVTPNQPEGGSRYFCISGPASVGHAGGLSPKAFDAMYATVAKTGTPMHRELKELLFRKEVTDEDT